MYETAKKAREALKSKARRLASEKTEKVSSSDWTPPEPLNADVKTGARPISRRAYKSGGKVEGSCGPMRADRKPRKAGGKAESPKEYANAKVNRDVKAANEEREGKKHVGGFKHGGRPGKNNGGANPVGREQDTYGLPPSDIKQKSSGTIESQTPKTPNLPKKPPLPPRRPPAKTMSADEAGEMLKPRKDGGRAKKMMGGPMMDPRMGMVKDKALDFGGQGITPGVSAMKRGGKASKHADEAMDKALIKKMVKAEARKGKAIGGILTKSGMGGLIPMALESMRGGDDDKKEKKHGGRAGKAGGGMLEASKRAMMLAKDPHNQPKIRPQAPEPKPEDKKDERTARKDGGSVKGKGKTQINIMISTGPKPGMDQDPMMPPLPPGPPGGIPVPVPGGPDMGAAPPPMPMPMPAPMPMPPGGHMGPPMPPMPRKSGGRVQKMGGGALSQQAAPAPQGNQGGGFRGMMNSMRQNPNAFSQMGQNAMQRRAAPVGQSPSGMGTPGRFFGNQPVSSPAQMGTPDRFFGGQPAPAPTQMGMSQQMPSMAAPVAPMPRKAGGRVTKVASSYKDMEAGAGSGEGRLQKTDIAAKQPKPGLKRGVIVDDNKGYPNKVNGATGGRTAKQDGGAAMNQQYAKYLEDKGSDFKNMQHMGKTVPGTGVLSRDDTQSELQQKMGSLGMKKGGRAGRATGGKAYRSYKDMDAGAGSGKGRLEKTEIESRKK